MCREAVEGLAPIRKYRRLEQSQWGELFEEAVVLGKEVFRDTVEAAKRENHNR